MGETFRDDSKAYMTKHRARRGQVLSQFITNQGDAGTRTDKKTMEQKSTPRSDLYTQTHDAGETTQQREKKGHFNEQW